MIDDPWKDIAAPGNLESISAKRVDPQNPWGFFWGRAVDRKCLFVLSRSPDAAIKTRMPKLRGIEVLDVARGEERMLMFKLLDDGHRDIFEELCRNIVGCAAVAKTETEAVALTLARTWRWHHLLRGGSDGRLTAEEQKGLAGELIVIERYALACLSAKDALNAWRGPLDSPKDFEIGRVCVEVKARRGAATPHIAVSSADQLDTAGTDRLFLFVVELDQAPEHTIPSFTLTELATRTRAALLGADDGVAEQFDQLLMAAGFDWDEDYTDTRWIEGTSRMFLIKEGFPRLSASEMPSGISRVHYCVALQDCMPFLAEDEALANVLNARRHAD